MREFIYDTPDEAYAEALRIIEKARRECAGVLDLRGFGLPKVPSEIGQLTLLRELNLSNNQLTGLPPETWHLKALTVLNLSKNHLTRVPPEIRQIKALWGLNLSENHLTTLPPEIGQLTALTHLHLHSNQLTALPPEIGQLTELGELFLHGNPELGIPESTLGPTVDAILRGGKKSPARPGDILAFYFERKKQAALGTLRRVGEIKVMLVGRGGAGKTSLRRFFLGQRHNHKEPETPGIALDSFPLKTAQGPVTVRLWDFAGQEITHALHQFFLTEGCVYVLVLDPRSNTEMKDAEYWLGLLKRYAGDAPVVVALNRQDARPPAGYDVDRARLRQRFPGVREFVKTNCETRRGCDELLREVREAVAALPKTEPPALEVPRAWLDVMRNCEKQAGGDRKRNKLSLDEFREVCAAHDVAETEAQERLARLLHQLGAVLHFVDEPRLRDTAVLNPHWVTDAVYRLLRHKEAPHSDGILTLVDARKALPGESEENVRYFLRLMERFDMCFPVEENEDGAEAGKWLVPAALSEFTPAEVGLQWQEPGSVRLRYIYDPLPAGVLPRFIVLTHPLSDRQPQWRHGVVLVEGDAQALVRRGDKEDHVEITAFGPEPARLALLEMIQGTLDRINADLPKPAPYAQKELAGRPGEWRDIIVLEDAEIEKTAVVVRTPEGREKVDPTTELNETSEQESRDPERIPVPAFLSYSHLDMAAKKVFELNLSAMMKKKFLTPWHDGLIEPGTAWLEDIDRNLATMDVFIGLLTNAFVASDFIETVEVKAALEKLKKSGRDFLFFLILVDDIPLTGLDLAVYQIIKPGGKAVCRHKNRREGFNRAQEEMEEHIRKLQAKRGGKRREDI